MEEGFGDKLYEYKGGVFVIIVEFLYLFDWLYIGWEF